MRSLRGSEKWKRVEVKENRRKVVEIAVDLELPCGLPPPEEALATSRKILRELRGQPEPKLTVGDLSVSKKYEREHRVEENRRWLKNRERGLTVGDLSVVAARKNMQGGLDGLYEGQGAYVQPSMCASQKLAAQMMTNHREKAKEQQHLAEYRSTR